MTGDGEMVSAAAFTALPNDVSGSLQNLRVLTIARIDCASAALAPLAPPAITVKNAAARGIKLDIDPATIAAGAGSFASRCQRTPGHGRRNVAAAGTVERHRAQVGG